MGGQKYVPPTQCPFPGSSREGKKKHDGSTAIGAGPSPTRSRSAQSQRGHATAARARTIASTGAPDNANRYKKKRHYKCGLQPHCACTMKSVGHATG